MLHVACMALATNSTYGYVCNVNIFFTFHSSLLRLTVAGFASNWIFNSIYASVFVFVFRLSIDVYLPQVEQAIVYCDETKLLCSPHCLCVDIITLVIFVVVVFFSYLLLLLLLSSYYNVIKT